MGGNRDLLGGRHIGRIRRSRRTAVQLAVWDRKSVSSVLGCPQVPVIVYYVVLLLLAICVPSVPANMIG